MDTYSKYKALKKSLDIVYKGVHMNRVIADRIWIIANGGVNYSFRSITRGLHVYDLKGIHTDKPIFSTYGLYDRKDHQETYHAVMERLGEDVVYTNCLRWGMKRCYSLLLLLRMLVSVLCCRGTKLTLRQKFGVAGEMAFYCNLINVLDRMDWSCVQKYLCMCNVLNVENLLTQYMKTKGIATYSLVEGIYIVYKNVIPIDCIQYENFETEHLLSWGQYSIDEFVKIGLPKERFLVAGYPKHVELKPMKKDNVMKSCMVLLSRDSYRTANLGLLEILSKYSVEQSFCLKLHPGSDHQFYADYAAAHHMTIIPNEKTINECLNNVGYDYCIAVNTSAYYESLMRGLPCLRYCDGSFPLMAGYADVFGDDEQYQEVYGKIKAADVQTYQKEVEESLAYVMGVGIDKYKQILCN